MFGIAVELAECAFGFFQRQQHRLFVDQQGLQGAGFDIRGIRPPTVAQGTARLRIAITLNVDEDNIDDLADALAEAMAAA